MREQLSITTIEGHLAYYVGTGEIPVNKFVSQEITESDHKSF